MKSRLLLAVLASFSVASCASFERHTTALEGSYRITIDASNGSEHVSGAGAIVLGSDCAMDVSLSVSGAQVDAANGSFRFVREAGGQTMVAQDGRDWAAFQSRNIGAGLAMILPLMVSQLPLDGYGDSLCQFGALPDFAAGTERLEFSSERVADLYSRSVKAATREAAKSLSRDPQTAACVSTKLAGMHPSANSAVSIFERAAKYSVATLSSSDGVVTYSQHATSGPDMFPATVTFTPQAAPVITAPLSTKAPAVSKYAQLVSELGCN
jgi:hypothetical protein